MATDDYRNELAHDRSFGPGSRKLKKQLLLFLGLGLGNPK